MPLLCWAKGYGDKAAPQELLVLHEAEILSWGEHCFCPSSRRCFTLPGSETTGLWAANVPWALQLVRGKAEPARGVSEHLPLVLCWPWDLPQPPGTPGLCGGSAQGQLCRRRKGLSPHSAPGDPRAAAGGAEEAPGADHPWQSWGCSPGPEEAPGRTHSPFQGLKEPMESTPCATRIRNGNLQLHAAINGNL